MGRSYLWQNFLKDSKYVNCIIERVKKNNFKKCFEVGPWKWALTKRLIDIFDEIYVFEKDETFIDILHGLLPVSNIVRGDVLEANLAELISERWLNIDEIAILGNIPYYITSPIFRKFFVENRFKYGIFMIQKEVWEKIKTDADKKSYLWWLLNYSYDVKFFKTVPAKAFSPVPQVDSCLVEMSYVWEKELSFENLLIVLDLISPYKRKTIWKILKMLEKKWYNIKVDEQVSLKRIEDLNWDDMGQIVGQI